MKRYNENLRNIREDRDIKQKQIAELLKITQSAYSKIERGERELKIEDLILICEFFHISSKEILGI